MKPTMKAVPANVAAWRVIENARVARGKLRQNAAMANHPNRGKAPTLAANPAPAAIREAREAAGLSQTDAAALVYAGLRAWQEWEAGTRRMHPAIWELWQLKAAQLARGQE